MVPEETSDIRVGSRVNCSGYIGTVKYIGEVLNTSGVWLGVDWDDPHRGKHNGTHVGVQYFEARYPTSGSFIRPNKVTPGISIIEAIEKRYGYIEDSNAGVDVQSLAQVQKEIKAKFFEVVGAKKLNQQQSDFSNLQVVLLREEPINGAGPPLELLRLCPNIRELDLSRTLLNSWISVSEITRQLKKLNILNLSDNRLEIPDVFDEELFVSVEHLVLGRLNYTWSEVLKCSEAFVNVKILQVPFNAITDLKTPPEQVFTYLTWLDLEGNQIRRWTEVNKLGNLKKLEILNLTNCDIEEVEFPSHEMTELFPNLKQLVLNENRINNWIYVSELSKLKSLKDLKFRENPLLLKENLETNRQLIIARIKNLKLLNGIEILPEERRGAEFDYIKRYGAEWLSIKTDEEKSNFHNIHPCYQKLVDRYGPPEENELRKMPTSLKSQLIQIEIFSPDHQVKSYSKRIPYNMSVQKLAGLIQRLFNTGYEIPRLACIHSKRTDNIEVPLDNNMKDLNYYSIENGDKISVRW